MCAGVLVKGQTGSVRSLAPIQGPHPTFFVSRLVSLQACSAFTWPQEASWPSISTYIRRTSTSFRERLSVLASFSRGFRMSTSLAMIASSSAFDLHSPMALMSRSNSRDQVGAPFLARPLRLFILPGIK